MLHDPRKITGGHGGPPLQNGYNSLICEVEDVGPLARTRRESVHRAEKNFAETTFEVMRAL